MMREELNDDQSICVIIEYWGILKRIKNALCEDGKRRTIELVGSPDTFFSHPGRARVNGKWVKGYITKIQYGEYPNAYVFISQKIPSDYRQMLNREVDKAQGDRSGSMSNWGSWGDII